MSAAAARASTDRPVTGHGRKKRVHRSQRPGTGAPPVIDKTAPGQAASDRVNHGRVDRKQAGTDITLTGIAPGEPIVRAAIDLFARQGTSVTTARIAHTAGVSNGTLFNHYRSKQALVDHVYLAIVQAMADTAQTSLRPTGPVKDRLLRYWDGQVRWGLDNMADHRAARVLSAALMVSRTAMDEAKDRFRPVHDTVSAVLNDTLTTGMDPARGRDGPADAYLHGLARAQMDAAIAHAQDRDYQGPALDRHIRLGFEIFWHGLHA